MKRHYLSAVAICIGLVAFGCTDRTDEWTKADAELQLDSLRVSINTALDQAGDRIARIQDSVDAAGYEMSGQLTQTLSDLKSERDAISTELAELRADSKDQFSTAQSDLEMRVNDLDSKIVRARLESVQARDEFLMAVDAQIDKIDDQIDELQEKADDASTESAAQYDTMLAQLRQQRDELRGEWSDLMSASEQEYRDARQALADAVASLDRKIGQAAQNMRETMTSAMNV